MEAAVKEDRKRKIHDVEQETEVNEPKKKCSVDAWSRISAAAASSSSTQGRGSLAGWVNCPLCKGYSKKKYAVGRGLANHLKNVHTPWKPSKMAQKMHRRQHEAQERETKRCRRTGDGDITISASFMPLIEYEPSPQQIDQWSAKMLAILRLVEHEQSADAEGDDVLNSGSTTTKANFGDSTRSVPYRDSLPSFLKAAADGDLNALKEAVEKAKEPNGGDTAIQNLLTTKDRHNSTADHWAAGGGHLECLKYLYGLKNGLDGNEASSSDNQKKKMRRRDGKTCLHYAARNGHNDCIRFLLDQHNQHSVDEPSGDGTTPLHLACYGGHYETVKYLIEQHGANVHAKNEWGCSCAHWVAMTINESSKEDIRKLCNYLRHEHKVSFVEVQGQGHTALHKAAHRGNRSIIEWMAQSKKQAGAGLIQSETVKAGAPDQGGHRPSDIWRTMQISAHNNEEFAKWMSHEMGW